MERVEKIAIKKSNKDNEEAVKENVVEGNKCISCAGITGVQIPMIPVTVDAYVIKEIYDNSGRFSDILNHCFSEYGKCVLPLSFTRIPHQVVSIEGYRLFEFEGVKYVYPEQINPAVISEWEAKISDCITQGNAFHVELTHSSDLFGKGKQEFLMTPLEWSTLAAEFSKYNANVIKAGDTNCLHLTVEGLCLGEK